MKNKEDSLINRIRGMIRNNFFLSKINDIRIHLLTKSKNKFFSEMSRKETFEYIYDNELWGGKNDTFYSGDGSHIPSFVESYSIFIKKFIKEHNIKSVCDLGCGDFYVASQWIEDKYQYIGIDIVKQMIEHHNQKYATPTRNFLCLDIVDDDLPQAELCIIRQVLQHLSNDEIIKILEKVKQYKYVLITEHKTIKQFARMLNPEKTHGSHTRVNDKAGIYLDEDPFNQQVTVMMTIPYENSARRNEELETILICH